MLPVAADEVILADGSKLSGTISSLANDGELRLDTPLAFEPFRLLAKDITRVNLSQPEAVRGDHDALIVLANDDRFACELKGIDATTVTVDTGFAGEIVIPRESVSTIQLGVRPRKLIYRGPESDAGWTIKNGWNFDSNRFAASRPGTISREFDIPGSFSLRFRIAWRNSPNIQIYFASDSFETTGKSDRYYLQFGASAFELKRQQSNDGHPYLSMKSILRDPSEFTNSAVDVELRVDRKLGIVHVYLDGEYEGKFKDPLDAAPTGQGIMFRSNIGGEDVQYIDRIEVREWNASSDRHRNEERGDESQDVMITRSSDRGTGSIIGLTPDKDGGGISFKSPHYPDPVSHPVSEVSTLFFARPESRPPAASPVMQLALRERGSLGITSCVLEGNQLKAEHPLLGPLTLSRDAVAGLERVGDEPEETESDEP